MPKFHIDEVIPRDKTTPMIVNFQNGYTTEAFKSNECFVLENKLNGKRTIATELNELIYSGEEVEEELGKTLMMVKNRATGKVRLIELCSADLKPVLKISEKSELVDTSYLELSRKFGSKKQKQQLEQREKLKVNIETVTEQMQSVTQNISEDKLDLSSYNKSDSDDFYIPPINRTADKADDVYEIEKILTEDQFEQIYSELENKEYSADFLPFIANIANKKKLSEQHTVLAVYANCLLKLYSLLMKEITKKNYEACSHSKTLNDIIMSNFLTSSNGRRTRPTTYKDKALCHALVFVLLINNFKFEIDSLCNDIKLTANSVSLKVRVTGATIATVGNKKVAQLKLPLNTKSGFRRKSSKF